MSEQTELLPCPFCGGKLAWNTDYCGFFHEELGEPFCAIGSLLIGKEDIAAWNHRAASPAEAKLAAIREAYDKHDYYEDVGRAIEQILEDGNGKDNRND